MARKNDQRPHEDEPTSMYNMPGTERFANLWLAKLCQPCHGSLEEHRLISEEISDIYVNLREQMFIPLMGSKANFIHVFYRIFYYHR